MTAAQEVVACLQCGESRVAYKSWHRKFCGNDCRNEWFKTHTAPNSGQFKKGIVPATAFKRGHKSWCQGKSNPYVVGEKNTNWRGGVTPEHRKARKSLRYKQWREAVFARDNYICVECRDTSKRRTIQADHIKPFAFFPFLRYDVNNGRTLCHDCHKKTSSYGVRSLEEYLRREAQAA